MDLKFKELIEKSSGTKEKLFVAAVYLFSRKGYGNVGIREISAACGIKESSFYNHFQSKESLLNEIFDYYETQSDTSNITIEEGEQQGVLNDIGAFLGYMMTKFSNIVNNPLFFTIRRIVVSEGFVNRRAGQSARKNLYAVRGEATEVIFREMMKRGVIRECNIEEVVREYYYGLMGMLDEYLLLEQWGEDTMVMFKRIEGHMRFYTEYLRRQ